MEKFKPNPHLIGERVILSKRQEAHDVDVWEAITESRTHLRQYLFWVDATKDFNDVIKATHRFNERWEEDDDWCYNLYDGQTHTLLGCIAVHNISFINQSVELGYWLRKSKLKQGYMTEAIHVLEKELFDHGIHRIEICCDINNKPSSNTALKAGYKLESIAKEAMYHYSGLHDKETYVKFSPYPIKGF